MSFGKSMAITAGFVGAFGLGVWAGPYLLRPAIDRAVATAPAHAADDVATTIDTHAPSAPRVSRPASNVPAADRTTEFKPMATNVKVSTPELHRRLKPLLKAGANMEIAAEGFNSAEQFATVAHAAQNTDVPFMLLKHRVLNEGDTLVAAIRKSKPGVDAVVEADRARAEARSDLTALD